MNNLTPDNLPRLASDIFTGHFHEKRGYRCYRPDGTADWLLIYTVGGGGLLHYADRQLRTAPGDAVLFAPHAHHHYQTDPAMGRWDLLWTHFHPRAHWIDFLHWPQVWPGLMRISASGPRQRRWQAAALIRMHVLAIGAHRRNQAFAMNKLEEILLHLDELNPDTESNRRDPRIKAAMDILFADLARPTSIATLARAARLSESRFAHLFKAHIGVSPREFLEQQRMNQARQMLTMSQHSIKQVAAAAGFSSPFYFSLRFKQRTGLSPLDFRRRSGQQPPGDTRRHHRQATGKLAKGGRARK